MGGAAVKAAKTWDTWTDKRQHVIDCVDELKASLKNKEELIQNFENLHRLLTGPISRNVRRVHMEACSTTNPTVVEIVQDIIKANTDELLLRAVCAVCYDLSHEKNNAILMHNNRLSQGLLKVARENFDDEFIMKDIQGTFAFCKESLTTMGLAMIEESRLHSKSIQNIYTAMRYQPKNPVVHARAMNTLIDICRDPDVSTQVLDSAEGGVKPILLTLCKFRLNVEIQTKGMQVLSLLAKSSNEVNGLLGRMGALSVIAGNLNASQTFDKRALQQAIWAINEIAKFKKNKSRCTNQARIGLVLRRATRILQETTAVEELAKLDREDGNTAPPNNQEDSSNITGLVEDIPCSKTNHILPETEISKRKMPNGNDPKHDAGEEAQRENVEVDTQRTIPFSEGKGFNSNDLVENYSDMNLHTEVLNENMDEREPTSAKNGLQKRERKNRVARTPGELVIPLKLKRMMRESEMKGEVENDLFQIKSPISHSDEEDDNFDYNGSEEIESDVELANIIQDFQKNGTKKMREMREKIEAKRSKAARFKTS